ncbi:hypothetical protein Skr01_60690 [Sphaerisporangium krabiense]|nr:hypothetical protein Skr01_60690 [Sphaerisporangium krabiense]
MTATGPGRRDAPGGRGHARAGPRGRADRAGLGRPQLAWLTVDMLKSGTRTAGMTARVK